MSNPSSSSSSYNNNPHHTHHNLTRFFLIVSLFVMAASIMAVYSTISASEYDLKKDDMHTHAIVHLVKSNDWLNDYEEQKLGEKILQSQIDNMNIILQNTTTIQKQAANNYLNKYKAYIDTLHADKSVEGSLANLQYKSEVENSEYDKTLNNISETSKIIMTYELVTILLIVGAGLAGTSEVTKNKMIAYPGFAVGGAGITILVLFLFTGTTV
jgi:cell division protein YceG involved in septum cleavage